MLKKGWYVFLLILTTIFVKINDKKIFATDFQTLNSYSLIFILWIVLLVLPLFAEFEILGFKIKKEVEKATGELKSEVKELKSQVFTMGVSNSVNTKVQFYSDRLPTKEEIKEIEKEIEKKPSNVDKEDINIATNEIPLKMLEFRFRLEILLKEICYKTGNINDIVPINMVGFLKVNKIIDNITSDLLIKILNIINRTLDGEIVSDEYINFVDVIFTDVETRLVKAKKELHPIVCPRCHFIGYSKDYNYCHICNSVICD